MIGEQVGPYEIVREMGRGGMGAVYRARRDDLNREFAIKFLLEGADDPRLRERFLREARAAAGLAGHPAIVTVHDAGEHQGKPYLVMDIVEGRSLEPIAREGELTPLESAVIIMKAARAMQHAHDAGVVHRDLKPANIMLADSRMPRITDFGLAKVQSADGELQRLTGTAELLGTPAYMPPEQVHGAPAAPAADIYALGATLYELCTTRPPFEGAGVMATLQAVLTERPVPPSRINRSVSRSLEAVILTCLEKDPADRYATAGALADDLEHVLRGEAVRVRPSVLFGRFGRRAARRPLRVVAGVTVIALLGIGVGWLATNPSARGAANARTADGVAREALAAERARQISAAWLELNQRGADDMTLLEDAWRGVPVASATVAGARARAAKTAAAVAGGNPLSEIAPAWAALAAFYARVPGALERLGAAGRSAQHDPFPEVLFAFANLSEWSFRVGLPGVEYVEGGGAHMGDVIEPGDAASFRLAAQDAAARAATRPMWTRLTHGKELLAQLGAIAHVARQEHAPALAALAPLTDSPVLGRTARFVRGLSAWSAQQADLAAAEFAKAGEGRWPAATGWAALAVLGVGGEPPAQAAARCERALALVDPLIAAGSANGDLRRYRVFALARLIRLRRGDVPEVRRLMAQADAEVEWCLARGFKPADMRDQRTHLLMNAAAAETEPGRRKAIYLRVVEDAGAVIALEPNALIFARRAEARRQLAGLAGSASPEAEPWLRGAFEDALESVRLRPDGAHERAQLALIAQEFGAVQLIAGGDPAEAFQAARESYAWLDAADAMLASMYLPRARFWRAQWEFELRRGRPWDDAAERMFGDLARHLDATPGDPDALLLRAVGRGRTAELTRDRAAALEHLEAAVADLRSYLRSRPDDRQAQRLLDGSAARIAQMKDR